MNIKIVTKNKKQKEAIVKGIYDGIKHAWGLIGVSDMLHHQDKKRVQIIKVVQYKWLTFGLKLIKKIQYLNHIRYLLKEKTNEYGR